MDYRIIDSNMRISAEDHVLLHAYAAFCKKIPSRDLLRYLLDKQNTDGIRFYDYFLNEYNGLSPERRTDFQAYYSFLNLSIDIQDYIAEFNRRPWEFSKPVIWSDRSKGDYYIENLTKSHRYELYVDSVLNEQGIDIGLYYDMDGQYNGESELGVEIKYDNRLSETENIYIEVSESLNPGQSLVNSGILKEDNTKVLAIGNYEQIFFLPKNLLLKLYTRESNEVPIRNVRATRGTSEGFIIRARDARTISIPIEQLPAYLNSID